MKGGVLKAPPEHRIAKRTASRNEIKEKEAGESTLTNLMGMFDE